MEEWLKAGRREKEGKEATGGKQKTSLGVGGDDSQ